MTPISRYLDEVLKKKGIKNYRQFAIKMQVTGAAISNIKSGQSVPSDEYCRKIAAISGDPVEKVLLLAAESRAPESTRKAWHSITEKLAKAGVFTLSLAIMLTASPALSRGIVESCILC